MKRLVIPNYWPANLALALLALMLGTQDKDWLQALADPVEWTDTKYGHQN